MEDEKKIIMKDIEAITDGGNNTAQEVRDVLAKMLNYTENEPGLIPIKLHTKKPVQNNGNSLFYSFKGLEEEFVNISFKLDIKDPTEMNIYSFQYHEDHKEKLIKILKEITSIGHTLDFVLPLLVNVENQSGGTENFVDKTQSSIPLNARITLLNQESGITIDFYGFGTKELNFNERENFVNAEITTSIIFHTSKLEG